MKETTIPEPDSSLQDDDVSTADLLDSILAPPKSILKTASSDLEARKMD